MNTETRFTRVKFAILICSLFLTMAQLSSQSMKTFHFGHSLVQHDNDYSNLFHWMYELSAEAGYSYTLEGQFGFLSNQATPPNLNMGSNLFNSAAWNTDFATSDFDNIVITAAYYAHYEFQCWENSYGVVRLDELHRIVDYARGETPDIKVYLYAPWTEPGEPTLMTASDFEYFKNDSRALHDWWITTQDTLNGSRQNLDAKIIPVGQVLADALDNVNGLDALGPVDLFVDDAGHGTPTFYFMAALVHYMARWGEQCPSTYTVPNNIHQVVRDNYAALVSYIWSELLTYNYPDGSSRVFFSTDETAPTVPQGLNSTGISATTADLSWNASTDENGVSAYRVYTNGVSPVAVTDTTVTISGLLPNTTYNFTVSAGDRAGNWSVQSSPYQVSTPNVAIYTLTVGNGSGDGNYSEGTEITVTADAPEAGYLFDAWTGDTQYLQSTKAAATTLTMPAVAVSVVASYAKIQTGDTIAIEAEDYTNMSGVQTEGTLDTGGGQQVGYINNDDWIEFDIDFPSSGQYKIEYRISSEGSVGDMSVTINGLNPTYVDLPTTGSFETFTSVLGEINVPSTGVQSLRITSIGEGWNINWIKLVPILTTKTYTLTVNNGAGSGDYEEGQVVTITAEVPPTGQVFYQWQGDVQYLNSSSNATTTVTLPAANITLTAVYSAVSSLATSEIEKEIFPNPLSRGEILHIHSKNMSGIKIIDIRGGIILTRNVENENAIINTSTFDKGMYFVILKAIDGDEEIRKVIVE